MSESPQDALNVPSPAIRSRVVELGYGSGPWTRLDLAEKWGDAMANKVLAEAKEAGWLVSPVRGEYYVPPVGDLMVVSWLPPPLRKEFIISRTLAASGLRFWSLSAWASTEGLLFSEPIFVTDLTRTTPPPSLKDLEPGKSPERLVERSRERAREVRSVPYLENVIIVPVMGRLSDKWERSRARLPTPGRLPGRVQDATRWPPASFGPPEAEASLPNIIEYQVTRRMEDASWIFAFLTALNIPRARQELRRLAEEEIRDSARRGAKKLTPAELMDRAMSWSAYFGPPSLNDNWQAVLESGAFPYLLVPRMIWDESLSLASSRMFEEMTKLRRSLDA